MTQQSEILKKNIYTFKVLGEVEDRFVWGFMKKTADLPYQ